MQKTQKKNIAKKLILIAIITYFFLLSIKLMGTSFKLFGTGFAEQIMAITANPFVALFIGILATSLVQSSSVTTSIIVGMTASGVITVGSAVPMIMGANIGTSITNTIVSLAHITNKKEFRKAFEVATVHDFFNILFVIVMLPIELYFHFLERSATFLTSILLGSGMGMTFNNPLNYILKPAVGGIKWFVYDSSIAMLVIAFAMLFLSLKYFVTVMRPLAETEFKDILHNYVFKTPLRSFGCGLLITTVVQSSSVSTSLAVPLAGIGLITIEKLFPYILGANVGTTFTALLASIVIGSPAALTVALEHFLFNTIGSAAIYPVRSIPIRLSKGLASLSMRSKAYPFTYIATVFYIIPIGIIFLFH